MIFSTIILGWIGILLFITIIFTLQKMVEENEYAFLHLLMAVMYAMWFPLPLALYQLLDSNILIVGTVFGFAYLFFLVMTMALQAGHIAFFMNHHDDSAITDKLGDYMMATLSSPFESLLGIFKSFWAFFLGISFWQNGEMFMASLLFLFSLLIFYYLLIALDASLVRRVKLLSKIKPSPLIVNLETLFFFILLMSYVTYQL